MVIRGNVPNPSKYHEVLPSTLLEKLDLKYPCSYCLRGKAKLKLKSLKRTCFIVQYGEMLFGEV
jgi:hypothetical protein